MASECWERPTANSGSPFFSRLAHQDVRTGGGSVGGQIDRCSRRSAASNFWITRVRIGELVIRGGVAGVHGEFLLKVADGFWDLDL